MINLRYWLLIFFFIVVWFIIVIRLFVVNVINHEYYEKFAEKNITKTEVLVPMRGLIFDRNTEPLAINEIGFSISLIPKIRNSRIVESEIERIISFLPSLDKEELFNLYKKNNHAYNHLPIEIVNFVPYAQMLSIYAYLKRSSYVVIAPNSKRLYPNESAASHVIGYVSKANDKDIQNNPLSQYSKVIGKEGIEKFYNSYLQGEAGYRKSHINSLHKEIKLLKEDSVLKRNDLYLSLDLKLQESIDSEFTERSGAVIVMNVHNGEILAAGSYPEYNINWFVDGISYKNWEGLIENVHKPLINKLVYGRYPPGSVIKMGMVLAFLQYAGINESTLIQTPPFIEFGGRKFRDWKASGHGSADAIKAIRESVDVYFYLLSQRAGIDNMASVLRQMGIGELTGVDIPNEVSGILPTPEWKLQRYGEQWYKGDTITTSIGQGYFLSTPMQIARYTALIASGKLVTPHFAKEFNEESAEFEAKDILSDFQKSKLDVLRKGMYQVCSVPGGTAYYRTQGTRVSLACKTGTAQVVGIPQDIQRRTREADMEYFHRSHAWITAFLPYENPQYAVTILIEHGGSGGSGGPVLVKIANKLKELGYIK
ncbi:penicillin-binding protein 2 [Helicobacter sp. MIT 03-1614]|jgi:penicillin-binding protein 2|uniref:Penicillin-binding protein n=1 Tax=Helicobacter hepaticus (strain ATCC 51449 / 3B1) TaxID=235279 RepID=Q7VGI9_HELHP|nr:MULTISPECIES: penicillin-binding protein 2 [Helicobacter]AAP77929.1 penicillin-binding protein [Helicobacter hepaticus ATCC 51449]TLD90761.1 penicillin-binding protein 2 [Helicobacter sp. MIT 03-1614]